ncbi:MAG TPA: hypothetical protein VG328_10940 [Stellaceae bacterium]|jgi:hypothetical protein|nr:hypothetical protein [Stellaceae bacterium]
MRIFRLLPALCFAAATIGPAQAADPFYLGTWKFTSAVVAPWAAPAARKPNRKERDALLDKTVSLKPKEIAGPRVFTCPRPNYRLKEYRVTDLFEGAFGEMRERDPAIDPDKLAARLGFKSKDIRTLETGCEFDWHFVDEATAEIGYDDWVYTLRKQ